MKIALCFSGQCRQPEKTNFKSNILHPLLEIGDVDVFLHFWSNLDRRKTAIDLTIYEQYVLDIFKPTKYIFEPQIKFNQKFQSMFYSILKCDSLVNESYDYIIRTRTDLLYDNILTKKFLVNDMLVRINNQTNINDQFAIGPYSLMKKYAQCYNYIEKKGINNVGIVPEVILYNHLVDSCVGFENIDKFNWTIFNPLIT